MTQEITNKALQWAQYELAAREAAELKWVAVWPKMHEASGEGYYYSCSELFPGRWFASSDVVLGQFDTLDEAKAAAEDDHKSGNNRPRVAANSILEELTPLFAEQARIKRWNNMRPGKEPRLI